MVSVMIDLNQKYLDLQTVEAQIQELQDKRQQLLEEIKRSETPSNASYLRWMQHE
jgi:hypothetical protein